MYWNYRLTFIHSDLTLICHHTCKLYILYMILELTVVHHSIYNMCMSKNNHVNRERNVLYLLYFKYVWFWLVFWVVNFRPCVPGGCDWNMANTFLEMFYNIIYHIYEGGGVLVFRISLSPSTRGNTNLEIYIKKVKQTKKLWKSPS